MQARTQSSVAISADGQAWYLLNASADVRQQLLTNAALWPPAGIARGTAIAGCLLTDAEIDHSSGLLQLREGGRFSIFSTATVRQWLTDYLPIRKILGSFADRPWFDYPAGDDLDLLLPDGTPSGLRVRALDVGEDVPRFVPAGATSSTRGSVVGMSISDTRSGAKLVYAPGIPAITPALRTAAQAASCLLVDGSFWSDDEPQRTGIAPLSSTEMGHVPVSGETGTLRWLEQLDVPHRVYVHINNTNPMLNVRSREHAQVAAAGVRVGADGDAWTL